MHLLDSQTITIFYLVLQYELNGCLFDDKYYFQMKNAVKFQITSKNMFFIFCKLNKLKKHVFHLLQAQKHGFHFLQACKTWKNMFFICWKLNKFQKHGFHFLQAYKTSKNMDFIFCKLAKPQKTWFSSFAS